MEYNVIGWLNGDWLVYDTLITLYSWQPKPITSTMERFYYAPDPTFVSFLCAVSGSGGVNQKVNRMDEGNHFILIEDWMLELDMTLPELITFAIIYGFTKDGGWFYGSQEYIGKWAKASTKTVGRSLNSLIEKGYIEKKPDTKRFETRSYRWTNCRTTNCPIDKMSNDKDKLSYGTVDKMSYGEDKLSDNNIYINTYTSSYHSYKSDKEEDIYRQLDETLEYDPLYDEGYPFS